MLLAEFGSTLTPGNSTSLIVKQNVEVQTVVRQPNSVKAFITVLFLQIPIITFDLPFIFKCLPFPPKVAFAMTTKKAQGQILLKWPDRTQRINVFLEQLSTCHTILQLKCHPVNISSNTIQKSTLYICFCKQLLVYYP